MTTSTPPRLVTTAFDHTHASTLEYTYSLRSKTVFEVYTKYGSRHALWHCTRSDAVKRWSKVSAKAKAQLLKCKTVSFSA